MRSLFSSRSSNAETVKTTSNKHSPRRSSRSCASKAKSDRLSEARVQAELAKTNIAQQQAVKEAQQKKLAAEREAARQKIEFERRAAQEKAAKEREAARRQFELDEQRRIRDEEIKQQDIQRRLLQEETERQQRELDEELETRRQIAEYERLRAEVKIREREELRSTLGSDYESSDEERDDVTEPKKTATKTLGFQSIDDQQASMRKILQEFSKPTNVVENKTEPKRSVTNWLDDSNEFTAKTLKVPHNTPALPREGCVPPIETRRDDFSAQTNPAEAKVFGKYRPPQNVEGRSECSSMKDKSDAALFSQVVQ